MVSCVPGEVPTSLGYDARLLDHSDLPLPTTKMDGSGSRARPGRCPAPRTPSFRRQARPGGLIAIEPASKPSSGRPSVAEPKVVSNVTFFVLPASRTPIRKIEPRQPCRRAAARRHRTPRLRPRCRLLRPSPSHPARTNTVGQTPMKILATKLSVVFVPPKELACAQAGIGKVASGHRTATDDGEKAKAAAAKERRNAKSNSNAVLLG